MEIHETPVAEVPTKENDMHGVPNRTARHVSAKRIAARLTTAAAGPSGRRTARRWVAAMVMVLAGCGVWSSAAQADFSISSFSAGAFNQDGTPSTQADAHPWALTTSFAFDTVQTDQGTTMPGGNVKNLTFDLPAGVVGNPSAMPTCSQAGMDQLGNCPTDTQVGVAEVTAAFIGPPSTRQVPVYNLTPPPGEPAQFGFVVIAAVAHVDLHVRSDSDYGLTATLANINGTAPVFGSTLTLWGVPADPSHDAERYLPGASSPGDANGNPLPSQTVPVPFLRNPTSCTGPLTTKMQATSWQNPDQVVTSSAQAPAITGCGSAPFDPSISVAPDTTQAGGPAGYDVDVNVPQNNNIAGLAAADLKRAVVSLPAGVAINPSAADGLQGCADTLFGVGSLNALGCPDGSKIGTVRITTPLLSDPLVGSIYLAQPLAQSPAAAASGQMYRIFLEAEGSGVTVKLPGSIVPDPVTGQLTATFDNNPQLPFSNLHLEFQGGARAPLTAPATCGTFTTHAQLTPWSSVDGAAVSSDSSFTIDQGCGQAGQFTPSMDAGLTNPAAGASTSFTLNVGRPDGQQDISSLAITLPPGLMARVGSVPLCPEDQAAAGSCSADSQVGTATVAAGVGTSPLYVPQAGKSPTAVYLAGPYKGAPFSLSIVVPAQAGPFDLGTVVVRAALFVDPNDAHVTVKSDPMPTILDGVPLRVQKLSVTLDRPGFMVSPTNCDPMQIVGAINSAQGTSASVASRFQMGGCAALPFNPQFSASSNGTLRFKQGAAFKVHIGMPAGDANIKSVSLRLPKELPSRLIPTINNACVLSQYVADYTKCPEDSYVGTVSATTPILPQPLVGPVYIVAPPNDVPQLKLKLFGQGIGTGVNIELSGDIIIDSGGGRSKATFDTVPDVPISSFDLDLPAGPHSILDAPNGDLCKGPITADLSIIAQNGKRQDTSPVIKVADCPKIPRAKIVSVKVSRSGVTVKVKPAAVGTLTVGGAKLVKVTRSIPRPNVTYTIVQRLSAAGKRAVARNGSVKVTPTVAYRPTNGPKTLTSKSKPVTVKGKKTVK